MTNSYRKTKKKYLKRKNCESRSVNINNIQLILLKEIFKIKLIKSLQFIYYKGNILIDRYECLSLLFFF